MHSSDLLEPPTAVALRLRSKPRSYLWLSQGLPGALARTWRAALAIVALAVREVRHWRFTRLPLRQRFALWSRGFLSEAMALYRLKRPAETAAYLSDYARSVRTNRINGAYAAILDDKLLFWLCLRNFSERIAPILAMFERGRLVYRAPGTRAARTPGELLQHLEPPLVLKPAGGSGGMNIYFYEREDGVARLNGIPVTAAAITDLFAASTILICPKIEQARYAREIFAGANHTIRLLTMYDDEAGEAFIARGMHRFGARTSQPVDSWEKSGLSAALDLESGVLGEAFRSAADDRLTRHLTHPDSGAPIAGVRISNWPLIRREILALAGSLPFLPYVGWDLIATDTGFFIIEGNNRPNVFGLQVHGPLLNDPRVVRFYRRYNVLPSGRGGGAVNSPLTKSGRHEIRFW